MEAEIALSLSSCMQTARKRRSACFVVVSQPSHSKKRLQQPLRLLVLTQHVSCISITTFASLCQTITRTFFALHQLKWNCNHLSLLLVRLVLLVVADVNQETQNMLVESVVVCENELEFYYGGRVQNGKHKASVWFPSVSLSFPSFFKQKMFCS